MNCIQPYLRHCTKLIRFPWIVLISSSVFFLTLVLLSPQSPRFHRLPSPAEERVTLPLLAGRGKCAPLWQMNDVKQTYLYSFRAEEEENPSVTDVIGTAMCECACIWVCVCTRVFERAPTDPSFVMNESCFCVV